MKKLLPIAVFFCLLGSAVFAQAPRKIDIKQQSFTDQRPEQFNYKGDWTDLYVPGKGVFNSRGVKLTRAGYEGKYPKRGGGAIVPQAFRGEVIETPNGAYFNSTQDARNLPLTADGRLASVDGFPVDFRVPNNPNDPGICATPRPYTVIPANASMANCPINVPCDVAANRDASIPNIADPIKYIKLNWVVVQSTSGGAGSNITQTRVDDLMTEVNADFAPFRIQFCADPVTFVTDDAMYTLNVATEDATLKTTYGTTPNLWCNVYVVGNIQNPSAGGYARFPYDPFGGYNIRGGVVLARGNMFLGTHTLAHELGHTFGLYHTFAGVDEVTPCTNCYEGNDNSPGPGQSIGGDTEGDWCQDTPPHPTNSNVCGDLGTDGCAPFNAWQNSPVNNHMSYSFCTTQFTPQQAGRMHCMIDTYLGNWVAFGGGTCGSLPPTAGFTCSPTLWQAPATVTFTDQSVPPSTITNWTWNFDVNGVGGAAPASWTGGPGVGDNPPPVVFSNCPQTYYISLTVTNANGSTTFFDSCVTTLCPAGGCDTLFSHWNTPPSTPSIFTFGPGNHVTGLPSQTLQGPASTVPMGLYERYITPAPGTTTVGAIRAGLGNYADADSSMTFQAVVYNCDPTGLPVPPVLGGVAGLNPGQDLGVPGAGFFFDFWLPFDKVVIDSPSFLVGIEMFPVQTADQMIVVSSGAGQGQNLGLNFVATNNFGYVNYNTFVGIDFDLDLIPMLGPWQTEFFINGLGSATACDTTLVLITDSAFFHQCLTSVQIKSAYAGTLTDTSLANVDSLLFLYFQPGPDTISFCTVNECNRVDTITYFLTYPFDTTPVPDFTMNMTNPICAGTAITFTATPPGMTDYTWDFGDGTVVSSGASPTQNHTYATPGLYYVTLTVTDASGCSAPITKLDFVEIVDCSVNPAVANFNVLPDTGCVGGTFTFTDNSAAVPDPPTGWFWAFDDGNFSLSQNPSHVYTAAGTYNVMLVVSNAGGTDTIYRQVVVINLPCTLPTDIILSATPVSSSVILAWETPADNDQIDFEIERSLDGNSFSQIGTVAWNEASAPHMYSYVDQDAPFDQTVYYRLREVSLNGDVSYSNVATARLTQDASDWIKVYPNPVESGRGLTIDAFLMDADDVTVAMHDMLGRAVYNSSKSLAAGMGRFSVATDQLADGTYFVRVTSSQGTQVKKVIVR